jgi:hypothetical protein
MGNTRGRLLVAAALTVAALIPFGSAQAAAVGGPQTETSESRNSVTLAGGRNIFGMNLKPRARITDAVTGAPLAGAQVSFFLPQSEFVPPICTAVTNAQGVATCGGVREQIYVFQSRGYRAEFQGGAIGDIFYWPSKDLVGLFGA